MVIPAEEFAEYQRWRRAHRSSESRVFYSESDGDKMFVRLAESERARIRWKALSIGWIIGSVVSSVLLWKGVL